MAVALPTELQSRIDANDWLDSNQRPIGSDKEGSHFIALLKILLQWACQVLNNLIIYKLIFKKQILMKYIILLLSGQPALLENK